MIYPNTKKQQTAGRTHWSHVGEMQKRQEGPKMIIKSQLSLKIMRKVEKNSDIKLGNEKNHIFFRIKS